MNVYGLMDELQTDLISVRRSQFWLRVPRERVLWSPQRPSLPQVNSEFSSL